jgi:hypothetical protein
MREGSKRPIVIVAACALLDEKGAVLIAKRPPGRPLAACGVSRARSSQRRAEEALTASCTRSLASRREAP